MPSLFWLALLLGYLTGVAAAVLFLPPRLVEPLHGALALTTVLMVAACGLLLRLRRIGRGTRSSSAVPPREPPAEARRSPGPARTPDEAQELPDERGQGDERDPGEDAPPPIVRLESPGAIAASELREILYQGQVEARLRPVASLTRPEDALYYALPRLRSLDDEPLGPARYRTTAARAGLLGMIDRLLLLRCVDLLRQARADGREATVLCGIAAASLADQGFMAELEQQLSDDRGVADRLVLALDHAVGDRVGRAAMAALRAQGVRFCLRRLGPPPLDPAALRRAGFGFVLLEAGRFARSAPDGALDPALLELQEVLGAHGPRLLIARNDAADVAIPGAWAFSPADGAFDLARPDAA